MSQIKSLTPEIGIKLHLTLTEVKTRSMRREKYDGKRIVETQKKWHEVGLGPAGPGQDQLVIMNMVMILRDPQKGGNSKDQRLKKDLLRKCGNLVEFHHMYLITVLTQMVILLHVPRPGIMYHGQTTSKISYNLTAWMMKKRRTTTVFQLPASSS